jgi:hypothetical protein
MLPQRMLSTVVVKTGICIGHGEFDKGFDVL